MQHITKTLVGLALGAAALMALPAAGASAVAEKSGACASLFQSNVKVGLTWQFTNPELNEGEVIRITSVSADSPGTDVRLTLFLPSGAEVTDEAPVGGTVEVTVTETGISRLVLEVLDVDGNVVEDTFKSQYVNFACDAAPDQDDDGIFDAGDNCPTVANADQADANADQVGDVCAQSLTPTGSAATTSASIALGLLLLGGGALFVARRHTAA